MLKGKKRRHQFKRSAGLFLSAILLFSMFPQTLLATEEKQNNNEITATAAEGLDMIGTIDEISQDGSSVYLDLSTGEGIKISFLKDTVFRLHLDPEGEFQEAPTPNREEHTTEIVDKAFDEYEEEYGVIDIDIDESDADFYTISTAALELRIEKDTSKMSLFDKNKEKVLWSESEPLQYGEGRTVQTLDTKDDEHFYGGGQQNGYYSHKNRSINIRVGGGWDAGAASSPVPFYLSTEGYGVMRHTFQPGVYDFSKTATFTHNEDRFDAYYFVEDTIPNIISEYTELTGEAALMPEYAFYLGHLDCFNGVHNGHGDTRTLMEDGMDYLNAYAENDMPLAWFLPNDGYGCGYGGLDNLEEFANAAADQGVETGLWTQSNLLPDPSLPEDDPLRRDIDGEVQAGVRAIKTDVAWVGPGYSMALDATRLAAEGIANVENSGGARPFVVSLNGWAGTQRYAGLWSGDQSGGNWEYIRMHIPTYIGAGLSGNPNIGSDMDGIFGGDAVIQTRDHQWKAFTPIQMDMDGWAGNHAKNPWHYGEPYASINRMYLKLKTEMMPYNYTIAEESTSTSMPMVRGMMLEFPEDPYTYGTQTQYQYMWGPSLLVAPIYNEADHQAGVRNGIYLPDEEQTWIDYFTGEQYQGGSVVNNVDAPLWKTPVFVKDGAIIPMAPENNSINHLDGSENRIFDIYPSGHSEFTLYEDDGKTLDYQDDKNLRTHITSEVTDDETVTITVGTAEGQGYQGMVTDKGTEFIVNTRQEPENLTAMVGDKEITLAEVSTEEEYNDSDNVFYYDEEPNLNKYATPGSEFEEVEITTAPKLYVKVEKTNITANEVSLIVDGFDNSQEDEIIDEEVPSTPTGLRAEDENITDRAIQLEWDEVDGEHVTYDLMIDGVVYTNVFKATDDDQTPYYVDERVQADTEYTYSVRAVNTRGPSEWSDEITATTKLDRFRNVPENMTGTANSSQSGSGPEAALDGDEGTTWHTDWNSGNELPHTFEIDMQLGYELDKFEYVPRDDAGNGTITEYNLDVSLDGKTYQNIITGGEFESSGETKTIEFDDNISARYIKLTITNAVGGFGSAAEFRPYKIDGTNGFVVGENIPDGVIDEEDLNFFASYMGFDQTNTWDQVSRVDINYNGVIDAYDLMYVAGQLGENPLEATGRDIQGELKIVPEQEEVQAGEEFTVEIIGEGLQDINAFNAEFVQDSRFSYVETSPTELTEHMLNYSQRVDGGSDAPNRVFVAFSNKGTQDTLEGSGTLATVTLRANEDLTFDVPASRLLLVNTSFDVLDEETMVPGDPDPDPEEPHEVILTNEDMTVTGDGDKMQDGEAAFDRLIDGDLNTLAELIWIFDEDQEEYAELPLEVDFTFNQPQQLLKFEVFNRTVGSNGLIKKLTATAYDQAGNAYDLGDKDVEKDAESVIYDFADLDVPEGTRFTDVTIEFLESHNSPRMLSVAEVEFTALHADDSEEPDEVDKSDLENLIAEAEALNEADYTPETWQNFSERLETAKNVFDDPAVTQAEVNIAIVTLQASISELEEIAEVEIDKRVLAALVEAHADKQAEDYTSESWEVFVEVLNSAEAVLTDEEVTQEEVDEAVIALQEAVEQLELLEAEEVDKSELETLVALQVDKLEADYTEESWEVFADALSHAEAVIADETATQTEVDEAIVALQDAVEQLKPVEPEVVDKENLATLVADAKEMDEADYTPETWDYFIQILNFAEAILATEDEEVTQEFVDLVEDLLLDAIEQLEDIKIEKVVKEKLEQLVTDAADYDANVYTDESYANLKAALETAQAVLADEEATQAEVDAAEANLQSAIDQLEEKKPSPIPEETEKSDLAELVAEAEALNAADYTTESYANLVEALRAAKAILANEEATQSDVDMAFATLEQALEDLEAVQSDGLDPEKPKDPAPSDPEDSSADGDSLPATATSIYNWLGIGFMLLIVGGLIVFLINRKKQSAK
ncbi:discoidin domain-containing protein [Amphibacillus sp. Q70]|uniref:discoidin domain-containing protein n=1 Tax=Amphibacillus sp. Q70 TaxID=3453416 RepID=UPI003F86F589